MWAYFVNRSIVLFISIILPYEHWTLTCSPYSIWENLTEDFKDFSLRFCFFISNPIPTITFCIIGIENIYFKTVECIRTLFIIKAVLNVTKVMKEKSK